MDHMEALDRVLEPEKLKLSPWSIARNILEAEARAAWVIDPTATPAERVSRALMLGLRDTEWLLRAVRDNRVEEEDNLRGRLKARARQERKRLKNKANEANVRPEFTNSGFVKRVGTVERVTSPDAFVEEVLDNVNYYDLCSQVVHSNADALWLAYEEVLPSMLLDTVYWFAKVSWWEHEYRGMDTDRLTPILSEAWEQADFPPPTKFWSQAPFFPESPTS